MARKVAIDWGLLPKESSSKVAEHEARREAVSEVTRALNVWAYSDEGAPRRRSRRRIRRRRA